MDGILDCTKLGRKVWLVKVPNSVAADWKPLFEQALRPSNLEEDAPSIQLGTVQVQAPTPGGSQEASVSLVVNSSLQGPRTFQLQQLTPPQGSLSLACSQRGAQQQAAGSGTVKDEPGAQPPVVVVGQVDYSFNAVPNLKEYMVDKQHAAASGGAGADLRTRVVQPYQETRENSLARLNVDKIGVLGVRRKAEEWRRVREENKRVRAGEGEVEHALFALFMRQPHWTLKGLQAETRQPPQHLRGVLEKIATHNKRGPYKDLWQLKKEYVEGGGAADEADG